ncbi:MAG: FecR family protein, partial [Pseudomonadota bacterium]
MKKTSRLFCALVAFFAVFISSAIAGDWTVSRVSGPAKFTMDGSQWWDVAPGLNLPNAAWVNTGRRGKVQLRRGKDTIYIGSNTLVAAYKKSAQRTQLKQDFGTVTIDVQKRNYDHMGVETPYMAAVVKGTKFTVSASSRKTDLSVERGSVEVTDRRTGAQSDVNGGESVSLGQRPKAAISVKSSVRSKKKRQSSVLTSSDHADKSAQITAAEPAKKSEPAEKPKEEVVVKEENEVDKKEDEHGHGHGHGHGHDDDDDDDDDD